MKKKASIFLVVLAACGVGAFNEILEFFAVVLLENTGVGNYINNAQDLIFNLAGAIVGVWVYTKWILKSPK